jgi:hypothetical protein
MPLTTPKGSGVHGPATPFLKPDSLTNFSKENEPSGLALSDYEGTLYYYARLDYSSAVRGKPSQRMGSLSLVRNYGEFFMDNGSKADGVGEAGKTVVGRATPMNAPPAGTDWMEYQSGLQTIALERLAITASRILELLSFVAVAFAAYYALSRGLEFLDSFRRGGSRV